MKEEIVLFETAKLAREKGFIDKDVDSFYNDDGTFELNPIDYKDKKEVLSKEFSLRYDIYLAPTQSLLQKWLRDKHGVHITPIYWDLDYKVYSYLIDTTFSKYNIDVDDNTEYTTYEEALEIGLQEALKLIKL